MIKLKPLTKEDLPFLLEVRNNESTRKYLENDSVFNLEQCTKWFNDTQPKWYIILNKEEQKVGYLRTNDDEVGCDIHPNYRRKGYARLAYNEYLKDKDYATLWVFEDNFAINLYESLGFKTYGEFKMVRSRKYVYMIYKKER
jgi:GNAT superfamily N-acetyltransferase